MTALAMLGIGMAICFVAAVLILIQGLTVPAGSALGLVGVALIGSSQLVNRVARPDRT